MYQFPLGVLLESFRTSTQDALKQAEALGLKGIQVYASRGDMTPQALQGINARSFCGASKTTDSSFPRCAAIWEWGLATKRKTRS